MMPHARSTDPQTSHDAARSVSNLKIVQDKICELLTTPKTDSALIHDYERLEDAPRASQSGLRTRRAELVDAGRVRATGDYETLPSGRRATLWVAVGDVTA